MIGILFLIRARRMGFAGMPVPAATLQCSQIGRQAMVAGVGQGLRTVRLTFQLWERCLERALRGQSLEPETSRPHATLERIAVGLRGQGSGNIKKGVATRGLG